MAFDLVIGGAISVLLLIYLGYALARPERALKAASSWLPISCNSSSTGFSSACLPGELGVYMAQLFTNQRTVLARSSARSSAASAPPASMLKIVSSTGRAMRCPASLFDAAAAIFSTVEPAGPAGAVAAPCLQHGGELRHQHQLAVLWRRDDDVVFQARWSG